MKHGTRIIAIRVACVAMAVLLCGGCSTTQPAEDEPAREFGGAQEDTRITEDELDGLTRSFADRYVSLLYSVCDGLKSGHSDPEQRRAAQVLLVDNATNVYDIASNADAFMRMLDLVVVTSLVNDVWGDDGKAVAVFGEKGETLVDALARAKAEARGLAERVLTDDQLEKVESLIYQWREENPEVTRPSFVRFSNFSHGRGESAADEVLSSPRLLPEVAEAGQAVAEARLVSERMFFWVKRAPFLLRWEATAIKDDWLATRQLETALAEMSRLTGQIEQLPENIEAEREAVLAGIDERLNHADGTIASVRSAIGEADEFANSLKPLSRSVGQTLRTGNDLFTRFDEWDRWKADIRPRPFDILEYERTASEVTLAATRMNELLSKTEHLLESRKTKEPMQEVNEFVEGHITTATSEIQEVADTLFWRACALLGILFVMLLVYRSIVHVFLSDR